MIEDKGIWYRCTRHDWLSRQLCLHCHEAANYRCLRCGSFWWNHPAYRDPCPECGHEYYEWLNKEDWGIR